MKYYPYQTFINKSIDPKLFYKALNIYERNTHIFNKRVFISCIEDFDENDVLKSFKVEKGDMALKLAMLPRSEEYEKSYQLLVYNYLANSITYIPYKMLQSGKKQLIPNFAYEIKFDEYLSKISLKVPIDIYNSSENMESKKWLIFMFNKICKLSIGTKNSLINKLADNYYLLIQSNKNYETYTLLYQKMKRCYFEQLNDKWPLPTDPKKHIYEDIAIASYLMVLWKNDESSLEDTTSTSSPNLGRPKFLDLGCGNGLLTYLLTAEGYTGTGIDIRERKTWPILRRLCPDLDLKEQALNPSEPNCFFPGYDWIIGNHCDELTPWIPHVSVRCEQQQQGTGVERSNVFLIPCCPFDFYGKYERRDTKLSHYQDYVNYVEELCTRRYGFTVRRDRLRIPSTKRICLIGTTTRSDNLCPDFQNIRLAGKQSDTNQSFAPRPKVEPVLNCTQLDQRIIATLVKRAFETVCSADPRNCLVLSSLGSDGFRDDDKPFWRCGGTVKISDFASGLSSMEKDALKKQHGGLRTLFKNHQHIFRVIGDNLSLAYDEALINTDKMVQAKIGPRTTLRDLLHKTRLCWFYLNHPQGCPYVSALCRYAHGTQELKQAPARMPRRT